MASPVLMSGSRAIWLAVVILMRFGASFWAASATSSVVRCDWTTTSSSALVLRFCSPVVLGSAVSAARVGVASADTAVRKPASNIVLDRTGNGGIGQSPQAVGAYVVLGVVHKKWRQLSPRKVTLFRYEIVTTPG